MGKLKRIVLVGKAGSGKDFLRDALVATGAIPDISVTTRPMRDGEKDGITYHYISDYLFDVIKSSKMLYEHVEFNTWKYGTLKYSWDNSDVFIFNPSGVKHIRKRERKECLVIYLNISEDVRRQRLDKRSDADTTERRLEADRVDFYGYDDYDMVITDPMFNTTDIINQIKEKWEEESKWPWMWMTYLRDSILRFARGSEKKR